ncbi:MAG: 50S ribosomal protein L24 [Thaumarchaeota archaeon]|nr:50S ribosomal protein L24 [Nitrososphaerota archaeon]
MSSKPSKVRRNFFNAPLHRRSARISSTISDDLRAKHGLRSIRVVKGDSVKVLRGEYKGVEGKVIRVYTKTGRLSLEGVTREKIAGGAVPVKIHASKVAVTTLNLDDKLRKNRLEGSKP